MKIIPVTTANLAVYLNLGKKIARVAPEELETIVEGLNELIGGRA